MISDEFPEYDIFALDPDGKAPMSLHLHVDDADATIAAALAAGAQLTRAMGPVLRRAFRQDSRPVRLRLADRAYDRSGRTR